MNIKLSLRYSLTFIVIHVVTNHLIFNFQMRRIAKLQPIRHMKCPRMTAMFLYWIQLKLSIFKVTLPVPLVEQELLTLYMCSSSVFSGVRVARSLAFSVVFCRSLFVLLSFILLAILLTIPFWFTYSDYPLVSSNSSPKRNSHALFELIVPEDNIFIKCRQVRNKNCTKVMSVGVFLRWIHTKRGIILKDVIFTLVYVWFLLSKISITIRGDN
jgi:hypothetical protein